MEQQRDIMCVGLPAWEGDYAKSTVELLSILAEKHRVLYVDYAHTLKDVVMGVARGSRVPIRRMLGLDDRLRQVTTKHGASVWVLTLPPILPVNWLPAGIAYDMLRRLNGTIALPFIKRAMNRLEMSDPIVINAFNPFLGLPLAGKLNESLLLYYCYDEIGSARWLKKHGERIERRFLGLVDAVITSSEALFARKRPAARQAFTVKNGVDAELFSGEADRTGRTVIPTIGYIGSIDDRIDYDLLEQVIPEFSHYRFQFIGRVTDEAYARRLRAFRNVQIVGPQPVQSLPGFVRRMSVGIIPFVKNEFTRNIYPLKINEYLAAGLPVVKTDFAVLPEFDGIVSTARSASEFSFKLKEEMILDMKERRIERVKFAAANSWRARAAEFERVISQIDDTIPTYKPRSAEPSSLSPSLA
jgi:glycosyltransferase involved in cell wall biosynthesis